MDGDGLSVRIALAAWLTVALATAGLATAGLAPAGLAPAALAPAGSAPARWRPTRVGAGGGPRPPGPGRVGTTGPGGSRARWP
jgi:hypothetical protein